MRGEKTERAPVTPTRKKPYVKPSLEKRERLTDIFEGGAVGGTPGGQP